VSKNDLELIRQALGAAESSIRLAKQLLVKIEGVGIEAKPKPIELPGVTGIFDGENMVSADGQSFPIPANYASKSMLVVGDTLKLVDEGKEKRFKQIEHVKRHKTSGILTKKDGKWKVVTSEGSYKVLPAAVAHFGADISSEVVLQLPANNLTVPYGAIEEVKKVEKETTKSTPIEESKEEKPEEKKPSDNPKVNELTQPVKKTTVEKPVIKSAEKSLPVKKTENQKPAVTSKPDIKEQPVSEKLVEKVVVNPEPLKAITIEPEPKKEELKKVEETKVVPVSSPSSTKIEVTPEEDELT